MAAETDEGHASRAGGCLLAFFFVCVCVCGFIVFVHGEFLMCFLVCSGWFSNVWKCVLGVLKGCSSVFVLWFASSGDLGLVSCWPLYCSFLEIRKKSIQGLGEKCTL